MEKLPHRFPSVMLALAGGLIVGTIVSGTRSPRLIAGGGDRSGDSIVATGPVTIGYDEGLKVQIPHEAVYLLDYKGGRLLATIPSYRKGVGPAKLVDSFVERDLVADFKLDLETGPKPHFLMTSGGLGAYSAGWAPLYVFETVSNQLAIYRVQTYIVGTNSKPKFELVQLLPYAGTPSLDGGR
jgi:hypothetical protein